MPDFDIDFCETHRDKVIPYVQRQIWPRPGRADHHLRPPEGARGAQGHRPRAADELWPGRPARQARPQPSDRSLDAGAQPQRRRPSSRRNIESDTDVKRLFDLAMKLEGLPRHSSTHAAGVVIGDRPLDELVPLYRDPRSDMPVTQFDMKYVEARGAGEVRLPRPQDPVGAEGRAAPARPARDRGRFRGAAVGRSGGLRTAPARRHGRRVPAGIRRHAADARGGPADQFRRHHRAGLALPPRPDGQYPAVRRPQERPRPDRLSASDAGGGAEGNLRHLRLPGTGDGGGEGARRLQPRRSRPAAPRDGQEDPVARWTRSAPASSRVLRRTTLRRPRPTSCST